jgi:hypothetical protein
MGLWEGWWNFQHIWIWMNFFEGRIVLLAQLLGLLVAFIGENLAVRLVREAFPKAPVNNLDLVNGRKYEKTK